MIGIYAIYLLIYAIGIYASGIYAMYSYEPFPHVVLVDESEHVRK